MAECPNCGDDVLTVVLKESGNPIVLDSAPDPERGQVIVLGESCRFVTTPDDWKVVRELALPVYRRHATHCTGFWHARTRLEAKRLAEEVNGR